MICKNCGQENKDGAKICESCGANLETDKNTKNDKIKISKEESRKRTEKQRQRSKDRDLMTYGLIIGSVMAFAVIFIVLSYFFKLGADREMAKSNKTETAIEENVELYEKALTTSEEKIKAKDYKKAIDILKAIPKEAGDYHKKGQDKLTEIEGLIVEDIKKAVAKEDYKEARKLASFADYLPDSKTLADIKEKLKGENVSLADLGLEDKKSDKKEETEEKASKDTENGEETSEEDAKTDSKEDAKEARANRRELAEKYDLEQLRATNSYGQNGNPAYTDIYKEADFLNKDLKIDAHMGEVRTEPNLNSGVAGYVNNGDKVHCEEVVNDGGRYWLKIEKGWISSKLITGEFRD